MGNSWHLWLPGAPAGEEPCLPICSLLPASHRPQPQRGPHKDEKASREAHVSQVAEVRKYPGSRELLAQGLQE